jgi:FHS family L-fucose permease-like MFS transporter
MIYATIFIFAFFLSWYLTGDLTLAGLFLIFVLINFGAFLFGKNNPGRTLSVMAGAVVCLVLITVLSSGTFAMWPIIAVGLFNSIMFPTIFTLAIDGLGQHTSQGSGILCFAIVGGAVVPLLMGALADSFGIHHSFLITLICYLYIMFYGMKGYKHGLA